jgi:predicted nucleotidyltransferase component of viral defense system
MAFKTKGKIILSGPIETLIKRYNPTTAQEFENALKEIIQEMTLAGLARANFFDKAAFYGGTALRIFHGLPRFSEDLDFTLLNQQPDFSLKTYFKSVTETLNSFGLQVEFEEVDKKVSTDIESAFLKANTKTHFLRIEAGKKFAEKIQGNKKITIKFEVDTTPAIGFETEVKVLPPPITASVRVLKISSLFGGKMHAILFRNWQRRVKGRDFYDLLWYLGQNIPIHLEYLENKMRDGKKWLEPRKMNQDDVLKILEQKINTIDLKNAAQDVASFIQDPAEVSGWSKELFLAAAKNLKTE